MAMAKRRMKRTHTKISIPDERSNCMENIPCGNFLFHYSYSYLNHHNMVYSNVKSVPHAYGFGYTVLYFHWFRYFWIFHSPFEFKSDDWNCAKRVCWWPAICSSSSFAVWCLCPLLFSIRILFFCLSRWGSANLLTLYPRSNCSHFRRSAFLPRRIIEIQNVYNFHIGVQFYIIRFYSIASQQPPRTHIYARTQCYTAACQVLLVDAVM